MNNEDAMLFQSDFTRDYKGNYGEFSSFKILYIVKNTSK